MAGETSGFYNFSPEEAEKYLIGQGLEPPKPRHEIDLETGNHIAFRMQQVERAAIFEDGRHQTNAEHCYAMTHLALWIIERERLDLDFGLVAAYITTHDDKEAYGGDTPIMGNPELLKTKVPREAAGYVLYQADLAMVPRVAGKADDYEWGNSPEKHFTNGIDAVEAGFQALNTHCALQRERKDDFRVMMNKQLRKASSDETTLYYMEWISREIGSHWEEWGCPSIDGDPQEIIDNIIAEIENEKTTTAEVISFIPRLFNPSKPAKADPAPIIDTVGNLRLIDDYRRPDQHPPTEPAA